MPRLLPLALALALPLLPTAAVGPPPRPELDDWTIDDVVNQEQAADFQLSPDGRFAAWVKSSPDKDKNELVGHLMRTDVKTGREVQLTRGAEACTAPRWSPDGTHLAFLSARPLPKGKGEAKADEEGPKTQIWLLDPTGGEPWPLTEGTRGVARFAWAGDGALVFAAQEDAGRRESVLKDDRKDGTVIVEDEVNEPPVRLFKVTLKDKKVTRLTDNRDRVEQLAVSPDGKHALAVHAQSLRYLYDNKTKPVVYLHDLSAGTRRRVFADARLNISALVWSPDGAGAYATNEHSSKPQLAQAGVTELYYLELKSLKETKVELGWPRGLLAQADNDSAPGVVALNDGFLALLADGTNVRPARFVRKGGAFDRQWLAGEHVRNLYGLAAAPDGKAVVYAHSAASRPVRWHRAALDGARLGEPTAVTALNDYLGKRRLARAEVVRWKGANGDEVEGLLYYPHGWQAGKRAPLVVQIHGGPASADLDSWDERWSYSANLVCARGAFVLRPNYHGSTGYGLKFLESICDGKYCEPELDDIDRGIDALVARGLVDGKRVGLTGWSNGAILTNQLVARSTRYRVAVAGAGSIEYVSDWASCEFGEAFDRFYLGKSPLEDLALYVKKSPFYRLDKVRTPTLILFGAEDRVVHPQQGWAHYRAMQALGQAPVRFVLFPGEKHGLKKLAHQRRKLQEEMAWLDRYLFEGKAEAGELIKDDSPLAWRLKREKAKRVEGKYGVAVNGVLAPETVRHGGLNVGRFEVTEAQYAEYDKNRRVAAGRENYPAAGLTYAQAAGYCAWLSKQTGRRYRLPTAAEAESLYEKPGGGDNTLDAWAGYAVNPEDAAKLRERLRELGGPAPLLKEVGSGRGVGKGEMVYDLGGNVAEWVATKDGKGAVRGGSADAPADDRGGAEAGAAYRGLRVVLD